MTVVADDAYSVPGNGGRAARRRKSSGRSKSGCLTCRQKRVKCDETKPACQRCRRLSLNCLWSSGVPSLGERRRGFGPLKSRLSHGWTPTFILPASSLPHSQALRQADDTTRQIEPSLTTAVDIDLNDDPSNAAPIDESPQDCALWISDLFNTAVSTTDLQVDVNDAEIENEQVSSSNSPGDSHFIGLEDFLASNHTPILDLTYLMADDMALSMLDRQAIDFYTSDFSHIHITKRFPWSTNALLLRLGYETPIVMRFLLAASMNELHRRESASSVEFKELAEVHFKIGCSHFSGLVAGGDGIPIDHRPVLASVFFSFLYLSRRKFVDRSKIRSLSKIASDYIREHKLHTLGTTSDEPMALGASLVQKFDNPSDKRLIPQLLRWIFFKDVQMAFHGCGGSIASHILGAVKSYDSLSRASSSLVNNIWGASYPESEVIDDLQNASATDCLYQVFTIMQEVNQFSSSPEPEPAFARDIQRKLQIMETEYQALFLLSPSKTSPRSPMLINVDLTISRFHATRIYFFRAGLPVHTQCPPGEALPPAVQNSLSAILAIAHGMFASELPSPYERLQWPLFMAGIETQDVIHREWILSHMRPSALKTSLSRVIKAQSYLGYRLLITIIKDIIKDVDRNIAAGNALEAFANQDSDGWVDVEDENDFCLW